MGAALDAARQEWGGDHEDDSDSAEGGNRHLDPSGDGRTLRYRLPAHSVQLQLRGAAVHNPHTSDREDVFNLFRQNQEGEGKRRFVDEPRYVLDVYGRLVDESLVEGDVLGEDDASGELMEFVARTRVGVENIDRLLVQLELFDVLPFMSRALSFFNMLRDESEASELLFFLLSRYDLDLDTALKRSPAQLGELIKRRAFNTMVVGS